jgi:lambda repressor-like predicted transcriptional regulator
MADTNSEEAAALASFPDGVQTEAFQAAIPIILALAHADANILAAADKKSKKLAAFQVAIPIILALSECGHELRAEVIELFKQLDGGELDEQETQATTALLADILFPTVDHRGLPGLDLVEAEEVDRSTDPEAKGILTRMDDEEAHFARQVQRLMDEKGLTQAELADKVGLGQPAISMMLNRVCRPQRKTVLRFAQALEIAPEELWPQFRQRTAKGGAGS